MVAGHLQIKKGYYYIVLSYKDENGKRKTPWISTGLKVKGNKRRAQALLLEARKSFEPPEPKSNRKLLTEYLEYWVEQHKPNIAESTYYAYKGLVKTINNYFAPMGIYLDNLKPRDIQEFYTEKQKTLKSSTVLNFHMILHNALRYAVKMDLISANPCDKVDRPKPGELNGTFCTPSEICKLLKIIEDTKLELIVKMALFYGMRRSEVVGLKWKAIDFDNNTFIVNHTVTESNFDGHMILIAKDRTKNKSSLRTYPLTDEMKKDLLKRRAEIEENRIKKASAYNNQYSEYVFVDENGALINPNSVTFSFWYLLKNHGFRKISFHTLRHTAASVLLAQGVNMKQIQEWLGHSTFKTTADIYSHLDSSTKNASASAMHNALNKRRKFKS